MKLSDYETHYLSVLRAIVLAPGSKIQELAEKTGIHSSSIHRYTAQLAQDGWIVRGSARPVEVSPSRRNLTPPFMCYPTQWVNAELIDRAVCEKLAAQCNHPAIQESLRLLELIIGTHPAQAGLARIIRSVTQVALDLATINLEALKLESILRDLFADKDKPSPDKG